MSMNLYALAENDEELASIRYELAQEWRRNFDIGDLTEEEKDWSAAGCPDKPAEPWDELEPYVAGEECPECGETARYDCACVRGYH